MMPQNEALLGWEIWTRVQSTQHRSSFWLNNKEYFKVSETNTFEQYYYTQELFTTFLEIFGELVFFLKDHLN